MSGDRFAPNLMDPLHCKYAIDHANAEIGRLEERVKAADNANADMGVKLQRCYGMLQVLRDAIDAGCFNRGLTNLDVFLRNELSNLIEELK